MSLCFTGEAYADTSPPFFRPPKVPQAVEKPVENRIRKGDLIFRLVCVLSALQCEAMDRVGIEPRRDLRLRLRGILGKAPNIVLDLFWCGNRANRRQKQPLHFRHDQG
jgi:hypothetical protein